MSDTKRRGSFLPYALALMAIALVVSFFVSVVLVGRSGVLYEFALAWEISSAIGRFALWAPGILLVSSALAAEKSARGGDFHDIAMVSLLPAMVVALALSLFFLLIVPQANARARWYEAASADFEVHLDRAKTAIRDGELKLAESLLQRCKSIARTEPRFVLTYDEMQRALVKAADESQDSLAQKTVSETDKDEVWEAANQLYLQALAASQAGKHFDAHYLARRALTVYPGRREVQRLVDKTWKDMQALGETAEQQAQAALYAEKLKGYRLFASGEYLEAYRVYLALSKQAPRDPDVINYLARSAESLNKSSFFLDEDRLAFTRTTAKPLVMTGFTQGGEPLLTILEASAAAASETGVYLRNLRLTLPGLVIESPFARLRGDALYTRAVDRDVPDVVYEPRVVQGGPPKVYAFSSPFSEADALRYLELSARPDDIPLAALLNARVDAQKFGLDPRPLLMNLATRFAYPFIMIMLALVGTALGIRFSSDTPPGLASNLIWAPLMVTFALPILSLLSGLGYTLLRLLATFLASEFILAAWLGFLGLCTVVSILVAARIAKHAPR